ncbi:L-lactate dehydrogenase B chain-like [Anthonomus grandis grandis]|uniref:L-lactate dehydrogenase B chain-like n=1 Tax=Anthonomus grandis grandis TaxID=2921223 RepID=UPI0021662568|nr:L-lactate dehydrogenase B chain-like [Anthonomus grandis grandis]
MSFATAILARRCPRLCHVFAKNPVHSFQFLGLYRGYSKKNECIKMGTKDKLMKIIGEQCNTNEDKVTVVGCGDVGMACTFSILAQGVSSDVTMIDLNADKMKGEMFDIQHGCLYLNAKVASGTDYAVTANSKICVITAGVRQKEGESRLNLVQRNTDVLKDIVPNLAKHSPDAIMLVVSNPCDILTWVTWKLSGFPKNRVLGSGTNLDTSRFRYYISQRLGISPDSVHGWVLGEHGDSSVAIWSGVNVAGVRLQDIHPEAGSDNDPENWKGVHKDVVQSAYDVIKLKGFTNWAIGLCASAQVKSIIRNSNKIHPASTYVKGMLGITDDVFLSMPCVLGRNGVSAVIDPNLNSEELCYMKYSAAKMLEVASGLKM